jgi:acyl dehydratase
MIPLGDHDRETDAADDLEAVGADVTDSALRAGLAAWDLAASTLAPAPTMDVGDEVEVAGGDVISSAPELARLTFNLAAVHHDARAAGGRRLVYGGHTIGIALSQVTRAFPGLLTVVGWHGCDHLGPVHEGDTLRSLVTLERLNDLDGGGRLAHLRVQVSADGETAGADRPVLDWRPVGVFG